MSNEYKEWLADQTFDSLAEDNLRVKQRLLMADTQLQAAEAKNELLKEEMELAPLCVQSCNIECEIKQLREENEKLTQQNKQMREALKKILNGTYTEYNIETGEKVGTFRLCTAQIEAIAQQALKGRADE
jgi:RNA polymerase-binding transcription factor DksA